MSDGSPLQVPMPLTMGSNELLMTRALLTHFGC
jgi:hypothetical protein